MRLPRWLGGRWIPASPITFVPNIVPNEKPRYSVCKHTRAAGTGWGKTIADAKDTAEEAIQSLALEDTLKGFERSDREIIRLLYEGYPGRKIIQALGLTSKELGEHLAQIKEKIQKAPALQAA